MKFDISPLEVEGSGILETRIVNTEKFSYFVKYSTVTKRCFVWSLSQGVRLFEVGNIRNLKLDKFINKILGSISLYENTQVKGEMFYA